MCNIRKMLNEPWIFSILKHVSCNLSSYTSGETIEYSKSNLDAFANLMHKYVKREVYSYSFYSHTNTILVIDLENMGKVHCNMSMSVRYPLAKTLVICKYFCRSTLIHSMRRCYSITIIIISYLISY